MHWQVGKTNHTQTELKCIPTTKEKKLGLTALTSNHVMLTYT